MRSVCMPMQGKRSHREYISIKQHKQNNINKTVRDYSMHSCLQQ